jgi:hypothetical protein
MRTGSLLVTAALLLALAGCVPADPHPSASPSASATPVFASDAEALAAAEKAYAAYVRISDQILIDGGAHPERLKAITSAALYAEELKGFQLTAKNGWHSTGGTTYDHFSMQAYQPGDLGSIIVAYVCSDVSHVDVLDSTGSSVVSPTRPERTPFSVTFAIEANNKLVIASDDVWTGGGVC